MKESYQSKYWEFYYPYVKYRLEKYSFSGLTEVLQLQFELQKKVNISRNRKNDRGGRLCHLKEKVNEFFRL